MVIILPKYTLPPFLTIADKQINYLCPTLLHHYSREYSSTAQRGQSTLTLATTVRGKHIYHVKKKLRLSLHDRLPTGRHLLGVSFIQA